MFKPDLAPSNLPVEKKLNPVEVVSFLSLCVEDASLPLSTEDRVALGSIIKKLSSVNSSISSDNKDKIEAKIPHNPEESPNEKSLETKVRKAIDIIKTSDALQVAFVGIGNITGISGGNTTGVSKYIFDKTTQRLEEGHGLAFLDNNIRGIDFDKENLFTKQEDLINRNGFFYAIQRLPFSGKSGNIYVSEHRMGTHLTIALRWSNESVNKITDEEVREGLTAKDNGPFLRKLIEECALTFIPGYYNNLKSLEKEKNKTI